jgi:hypothetical protein
MFRNHHQIASSLGYTISMYIYFMSPFLWLYVFCISSMYVHIPFWYI